ncbi:MAG: elongation factor Ts [Microgenomates group bacterium GW2011_GWC1_46_16]|nr:MAG: Elongation factor Ts [Microgenomates group bacterium GW2011_GWF1_46_12]KKU26725.1 MAG: elongation factor Ts [Microgenomates group bacterium GW2011_GWC1_46_16]KKU27570.1 MAG: Elongation factor Ts [Microgenomates group bacterium GW2011_GWF2_46_18]KKU45111.1 MAG: Elongation factor Ts [Microgenomates group bacterium GW2011_GWB1_46_7]KKU60260.1 MAG: Elongation factor Ts [Microgenomates group bacterium GW2011_GWE1_47_12]KKU62422.1 MAG: Elongation factor Ts [Microgenomates group bacterium GW2
MKITMEQIKELREETGAGVMEVRKALTESKGDVQKAKKLIAAQGLAKAEKKADRETGASHVFAYVHFNGKVGALVKLACETDFVAKTEDFQKLGKELAMQVASMKPASVEELLKQDYLRDPSKTVEVLVKGVSGKTGENVRVLAITCL